MYESGKKVAARLIAHYVKPTDEAGTQTPSLRDLLGELESRVESLQIELEDKNFELETSVNDANILSDRLRLVGDEKRKLRTSLDAAMFDYDELVRSTADIKIKASKADLEIQTYRDYATG